MKIVYILILFIGLVSKHGLSQSNYYMLGEGTSQKVSLLWTVNSWDKELDGVVIKRRTVLTDGTYSDWTLLTKSLLEQSNELSKSIENVTNQKSRVKQLNNKRITLFNNTGSESTVLVEHTKEGLSKELLRDENAISMLGLMFTYDYDIALLFGFAFEDYKLPKNGTIEYGLFTVLNGVESSSAVATYKYMIGDLPNVDVTVQKEKVKRKGKRLQLLFQYSGKELDSKNTLAGFNIYKKENNEDFLRVNKQVIWLSKDKEKRLLNYIDTIADINKTYKYAIAPVSVFNNEGEYYEVNWNLNNEVIILPPVASNQQHPNTDFIEDGAEIKWEFDEGNHTAIKGFLVQRKLDDNTNYSNISDTLSVEKRVFSDKSLVSATNISYRVVVVPIESNAMWSNDVRLYYNPKPIVENVYKLNIIPEIREQNVLVKLSWDVPVGFVEQIDGFVLYCDRSGGVLAREPNYQNIKSNQLNYIIEGAVGEEYRFTLKYENKDGEINNYSDTTSVIIPNTSLPKVNIWPFRTNDQQISFDWKYPNDLVDLIGFKVYVNDELIADENEVDKTVRTWQVENLEPGVYMVSIEAISSFGVISKRSDVRKLTVK